MAIDAPVPAGSRGWKHRRVLLRRVAFARRNRCSVLLAMLCALNRPHELKIHLVGALNNGCSKTELREIFTHAIAYCGFPAAIDALRVAEEVLKEQGKF